MKSFQVVTFLLVNGLLMTSAIPQQYGGGSGGGGSQGGGGSYSSGGQGAAYGGGNSAPAPAAPAVISVVAPAPAPIPVPLAPAPPATAPAAAPSASPVYNSASASAGGAPAYGGGGASSGGPTGGSASGGGGSSSGGGGSSGGNLQTQCQSMQTSPGKFSFVCNGVSPDAIKLRSEHVLWLQGDAGQQQVLDIQIPNYKIEELIKAGFKTQPGQGSLINVLLKKPEQSYDAQVDTPKSQQATPTVNLQYEPVQKTLVHYPNDKPYSPLTGPILPPLTGGRPQRQAAYQYNKNYNN